MAKFSGKIGFIQTVETSPGIWEEQSTEREYFGDIIRNAGRYQQSGGVNDNMLISNRISIVADSFINDNFQFMKYVIYEGALWKISDIEKEHPRINISLGGIYHE